jgi:hypothetical protein
MTGIAFGDFTAPLGYQQLTSTQLQTARALPSVPANARRVVLQSNGVQAIRWRDDGADPVAQSDGVAALGQRIEAGAEKEYVGNLSAVRVVGEGAGAVLDILYYG